MNTLFPVAPFYPPGFSYRENFISTGEEQALLEIIKEISLHTFLFQGYEAKRKVASFGHDWNFDKQQLVKGENFPPSLQWLVERVEKTLSIKSPGIAELLVTGYPPGAVINWHRDAPPFALIAGISLQADCVFRLRPYEKEKQGRKAIVAVPVKRRSLYVMDGEAREDWQHSTAAVKTVRYSITLRTLKRP